MTSLPVLQNRIETPDCFGQHWDPTAAECKGGPDINFTNPKTGSHIREKCFFFGSCGAKVQATRAAQQSQAIVPTTPFRAMVSAAASRQQMAPMSQPMQQAPVQAPQAAPMVHGQYHPAPTYQLAYGIPQYLSHPEPMAPGESVWNVLFREVLRGMFKSTGHTVASFFDRTPLRVPMTKPDE
jgi:hypothetical protein